MSDDVSDTAFSIAVVRANERLLPEDARLFDDPHAALFADAGAHAAESTQRYLDLPFFRDGVRLRTRYIDDAVREGLAAGLEQLVIVGAGFDMRGTRLLEATRPGVRTYEIDSAGQLERKAKILSEGGVRIPEHVGAVPVDFDAGDWTAELASRGFRAGAGAMFVWEGVIGYIDRQTIDASLRFMARAGGARSRIVFTFGELTFAPEGTEASLAATGFTLREELGLDAVWRRFLPGDPPEGASFSRVATADVA